MTNHNPTITSSSASGGFSENANTTGSNALHTLSGTMNFKDSDNLDTHTTSASLKTATLSSGTVVPADTLAQINSAMSSTILIDSNTSGKLKWTFSAEDDAFDFLSKNQTLTLRYEITLFDNHGGMTKKTVTVTITGTDDKPIIDFGTTAQVSEQAGQTLSFSHDTADLAIHFVDPDLTNTGHTVNVIDVSASGATGGLLPGLLGEMELRSFFDIDSVVKPSGSSNGTINATFSAPDLAFDDLSEGETLDIVYTLKINDNAGGSSTQTVTITVLGTNDDPIYISFPDTEHLEEGEDLSPTGQLTASGDFLFADIDLSDTHTVSTTVTATRSGGGVVPLTEAELLAALSTAVDPDSTGHLLGEVDWNFALDNSDVSFLTSGETLTITYTLTLTDDAGGTDTQTVTITILGTNDPVVVTSGPQAASLAEFADTTGSAALNTTTPVPTGAIAFTDTDIGDTHTVAVAVDSAVWSGGAGIPVATQADLAGALLTTLNDSTGTGSGSIDWTFSIADQDLDFLAFGESLTVTYDVSVSDGASSASQTVTVMIDGANDAVVMTGGPAAASAAEVPDQSGSPDPVTSTPPGGTFAFTDVDLSDLHQIAVSVTSVTWSADPSGEFIPSVLLDTLNVALATALNDSTGTGSGSVDWSFSIADQFLDFLNDGDTLTVTYDVAVQDGFTSSSQTVTITITGALDPLTVNPLTTVAADSASLDDGQAVAVGNLIVDANDSAGDQATTLSVTDVNGNPGNVGSFVAGTYGSLLVFSDGSYLFQANANLDLLEFGDTASEQFDFTVTDSLGRSETTTLTIDITGADDAAVIVSADSSATLTEDAGPTIIFNGDFEDGNLGGWTSSGTTTAEFTGFGGEFGNYAAKLAPTAAFESLSQDIATVAGEHYILSFFVSGDAESTSNSMTVTWDGTTILALADEFGGLTRYTFEVVAVDASSTLAFTYTDADGIGMYVDQVSVSPTTGPATETADGTITFADIEVGDTHTAGFIALDSGYFGTFSLDAVSEAGGSGSVDWHFTVDNADIQFLSQNQAIVQTYFVSITGPGGASVQQEVSITLTGTNDAPTAVGADNVITNADSSVFFIPEWMLTRNDTDTDVADTLHINSITGTSGMDAVLFGAVLALDDATLGGSFDYDTTDGLAVSAGSGTVTVTNSAASTTLLTGTGGDDIIVATVGGETLDGGAGDDILMGASGGAHVLTGGSGDDTFAFQFVPDDPNTISDFDNVVDQDLIAVAASAFGGELTAGMNVADVFESSADAMFLSTASRFHYDTSSNTLYFSADGTDASRITLAQLQSGVALNAQDLFIV